MTDEEFKKLRELIKEELRSTKDLAEMTKKKVDSYYLYLTSTTENVRLIKEQQSVMNEKLDKHSEALITIEDTNKIYGDMYKMNNDNVKKLEQRIEPLEKNAGVTPPPELTLAEVS